MGDAVTVTIAATWTGSFAVPFAYSPPGGPPAALPVQVPVTNTAGDWLFAIVSVRQPETGAGVSVAVADDAHNWWEPVGAPSGDSSAAGVTRSMVWAAPAARVANAQTGVTNIQVAATGAYLSVAVVIADVAGLQPWYQAVAPATGFALAASSFSLSAGAPSAQALMFAQAATDLSTVSHLGPGAGWTGLPGVSTGNGTDHTADLEMLSYWQVTTGAASAAWTSSGATDWSGIITGVLVSAPASALPSPAWPVVITEAAPGAGALTAPSQLAWTPLSARSLDMSVQQGRQYTLSQLQAGQGTMTIDNPDGALIPPGTGSFAGIDSGTPVRQRVIIPALPSPHYVAYSGFFKRWPFALETDLYRGKTVAEITDIWGYGNGILNAMGIEECLLDDPYALWPMTDPAGSTGASNIAPGNGNPLTLTLSKYGAGGATQAWGQNSSGLLGMASAKVTASGKSGGAAGMFGQTLAGTSLNTNAYGYALGCADGNYPPVAGGVTIEAWFQDTVTTGNGGNNGFLAVTAGSQFTFSPAALANGTPVVLTSVVGFTFPGGFTAGVIYYVINASGNNFQLAATPGGAAITVTAGGTGLLAATTPWNPIVFSARNIAGPVAQIEISNTTGALLLRYKPATGTQTVVTVDGALDYRIISGMIYVAAAFNATSWRVTIGGIGAATHAGTFSSPLAARFTEVWFCGVQDRATQGWAFSGFAAMGAVYPVMLAPARVYSHYLSTGFGSANENPENRIERICEYAGLTGRRWLGQQATVYETDQVTSGQDIGGQAAVSSANNIAASTLPAVLYVAPTGDIVYAAKAYQWNQPVRWILGDNTSGTLLADEAGNPLLDEAGNPLLAEAGGEIPFLPAQFATDYDPSKVVADVQLTQLDTQSVTTPAGVMAAATVAAVAAAAGAQYGAQAYQQTAYLARDWSSAYNAGSGLQDLANWLQDVYAKPRNRVQAITVEAAANAANINWQAWQFWAAVCVNDMVTVNLRLPTAATSPLISLTARVTQVQRSGQFSQAGTSAKVTCVLDFAPEYAALICDDPVRGLLSGTNVLAW